MAASTPGQASQGGARGPRRAWIALALGAACTGPALIRHAWPSRPMARPAAAAGPALVKVAETVLRSIARTQVMPAYPAASVARRSAGVAVAEVVVGVDGRPESVQVLQAPDDDAGEALRAALGQWTFGTVASHEAQGRVPVRARGKLTFYFRLDGERAAVVNAADAARQATR